MTLAEFLLARIAEDEEVTRTNARGGTFTEPGYVLHDSDCIFLWAVESSDRTCECNGEKRWAAEVETKRRIVALHGDNEADAWCQSAAGNWSYEPCETLRLLAMPYADHPDYPVATDSATFDRS